MEVLKILEGILENVGYTKLPIESKSQEAVRLFALEWACYFNHSKCKEIATKTLLHHIDHSDEMQK